ncbi:MAG: peptide chain release factor N(5)-glutamine methyltransferase [Firmicutes bacterium]|nr:peptide chain release factor N(5)-glutamine methyltransferase [Bacillota bacterium]
MVIGALTALVRGIIANSDNPQFEAELIVMDAAGLTRTEYVLSLRENADDAVVKAAVAAADKRKSGMPLAYILKSAEFMGMTFKVTRDTLIPRPDTETLVETAAGHISDARRKVLDIGAGTGCVGISIAKLCKNAEVTLLDISAGALSVAEENARLNGVSANFELCDILTALPEGRFDAIVSNPPYIKSGVIKTLQTEVKDYEPLTALDGGADGLMFYRRICAAARDLLTDGGFLAFEIGYDQAAEVTALMSDFDNVATVKDLSGNDRVVHGIKKRIDGRRGI